MKAINGIVAILSTLFVASVTGSLLLGAIHFGFGAPAVAVIGVTFVIVTFGVGAVGIMEAMED